MLSGSTDGYFQVRSSDQNEFNVNFVDKKVPLYCFDYSEVSLQGKRNGDSYQIFQAVLSWFEPVIEKGEDGKGGEPTCYDFTDPECLAQWEAFEEESEEEAQP